MRWFRPRLLAAALGAFSAALLVPPAFAQQPPATPHVEGRAAWDDRFIYFALVVDDSDILGTHSRPMSEVLQDDSVAVYFHTSAERPETPTAQTRAMVVSAAGGFTFLAGDLSRKEFVPSPIFTIKYGVTLQGTLNRTDDRDRGYTITIAVPWAGLGIDPKTIKAGQEIAFTAVVRRRGATAADSGLTATAEGVKTEADTASPAKYGKLIFAAAEDPKAPAPPAGTIVAMRVAEKTNPPAIDGTFRPEAWSAATKFAFASPDIPRPEIIVKPTVLPGSEADSVAPTLKLTAPLAGMTPLLMARYLIGYQGDIRKAATPARGLLLPDATLAFPDQPATGFGPWFSSDRTSWHKSQFTEMARAGVDAALVNYMGPDAQIGILDEKALLVMVTALREMASEGTPAPRVVPNIETALIVAPGAPKPDLATTEGRDLLYRAIREWFNLVPAELRLKVLLPPDENGKVVAAYPVYLTTAESFANAGDPGWVEDMRKRFAAEFGPATGGATLLLCGEPDFPAEAGLAAYSPLLGGGKGTGPIPTAVVCPGSEGISAPLVARKVGQTYRDSWTVATGSKPTWLIIDSWNDWIRATEITTSRQYGNRYVDMTRILAGTMLVAGTRNVAWLANDAPRRVRPGQISTVTVSVKNIGTDVLRGEDGLAITYRWRSADGKIAATGPLRLPLVNPLTPNRTLNLPVGVVASRLNENDRLEPLPAGEYTLEIGLTNSPPLAKPVFFGDDPKEQSLPPLRVPVTITDDFPEIVEFASSNAPSVLVGGGTYPILLRMRWMGREALTPEKAQLIYQFLSEDGKQTVLTGTIPLTAVLQPGVWQNVIAQVKVGDGGGGLPPAAPEVRAPNAPNGGNYRLRWLLSRKESTDAIPGEYVDRMAVYPSAEAAQIAPPPALDKAEAGALVPMEVTVVNRGTQRWKKGTVSVGYHWYYADGLESEWMPPLTVPLSKDLDPGQSLKVSVPVRMPDREGVFILGFDVLQAPDIFLSTLPVTANGDLGLVPVRVVGGRLAFANLESFFNLDAVSSEGNPGDGDLDGKGFTLPAESFPPDAVGITAYFNPDSDNGKGAKDAPPYPSGLFSDMSRSARLVSFRYGSDRDGAKNAIACKGQTIPLPTGRFATLHLAVTATGGEARPLTVTVKYKDGTEGKTTVTVGDWLRPQEKVDPIAVRAFRRRSKDGDTPGFVLVRHAIVPVDIKKEIVSITLPNDELLKVFAITLEK